MDTQFALSSLSRLLVGLLEKIGANDLVVSPGSRSTPYLSAALECSRMRVHLVVDERSAGYVALGLARARRHPVALLCTSGTAAANYLPALVEAQLTGVPLVVLTADRPLDLQRCAAPQTIDQTRLYGSHVVASTSLTVPNGGSHDLKRMRRQILSTLALVHGDSPGPVHINLHTPKPLELVGPSTAEERETQASVDALIAETPRIDASSPARFGNGAIERLVSAAMVEPMGLIACGFEPDECALDPSALARFARATGYPVLLDASHPLRFDAPPELRPYLVAPFESLLQIEPWRLSQAPRLVIQIGRPLTSSAFERWMLATDAGARIGRHLLLTRSGWPDPLGTAERVGQGDLSDALQRASVQLESSAPRSSGWAARWYRAAGVAQDCVANLIRRPVSGSRDELGELDAVWTTLSAQPQSARLVIGNSLPIREVDLLASTSLPRLRVVAMRGASGIDGVVSLAAGVARVEERPTTLMLGDISFLHDVGGLWATATLTSPLAIVVLNNGGGRIFEQLPIARAVDEETLRHWTTPQQLDLAGAARLYGLEYFRAERASTLAAAIAEAHDRPGATIIEAVVSPDSSRRQRDELVENTRVALLRAGLVAEDNGV